jgi:hypothetical protein
MRDLLQPMHWSSEQCQIEPISTALFFDLDEDSYMLQFQSQGSYFQLYPLQQHLVGTPDREHNLCDT